MTSLLISMVVMINPFALFVYLVPVMEDISFKDFFKVLFKASITSFVIYAIFSQFGEFIFERVLLIHFESFRVFGGIVILIIALVVIIQGKKSFITLKGSLDDLASEIAMPFMVGGSSIAISILIGQKFPPLLALGIILLALIINFLIIALLVFIKEKMPSKRLKIAFDTFMGYFLRINGFLIGAIGVDMTLTGIQNLYS